MNSRIAPFITLLICLFNIASSGQKEKHSAYTTVTASNTIVNSYTALTVNAAAGATSITVANNNLNSGSVFTNNLEAGDLIYIIQHHGGVIQGSAGGWAPGNFWGWVTNSNFNNAGFNEFVEVASVSGSGTINLVCGLIHDYTSNDNVQVVRVPRLADLTVNNGASITATSWNGTTGGVVALEVNGDLVINGSIDVSELGYRGGQVDQNSTGFITGEKASTNPQYGGEKGEGFAGYGADYDAHGGRYCKGAAANAGGGGNGDNSGGGGGANVAPTNWVDGFGNPDPTPGYAAAWNVEGGTMSSTYSEGSGGRGGYSSSSNDENALTLGPDQVAWGNDERSNVGGYGGRPLIASQLALGRLIFGGGGGAGSSNDGYGGSGGSGGGMVNILCYGNVSGSGSIEANGQDGFDAGNVPASGFNPVTGGDAAGGAGAGGTIRIRCIGNISVANLTANGGKGGDQILNALIGFTNVCQGPGGGGGGGYITTTATTSTRSVLGGLNGVTNSDALTEFPPNGATIGTVGVTSNAETIYDLVIEDDTICGGGTTTLTVTTVGTVPGTINWYSSIGGAPIHTGTSLTTPTLTSNTTYYVGTCPGQHLTEVNVLVSPAITINAAGVSISDENCGNADGSIAGIAASGGTGTLVYDWNGTTTANANLNNVAANNYTLTVTDDNGCTATSGPHVISNIGGPMIDVSSINISDENCGNADGTVTGIVVTGVSGSETYSWNGNASTNADLGASAAGNYTLTVTDGACSATSGPHTINNNTAGPVISVTGITINDENCGDGDGSIAGITATGNGTLSYSWNGGAAQTSADIFSLSANNYTLTVTDGNGCTSTSGPHTINNNAAGPLVDVSGISITDANCGNTDGSITGITATGNGTLSYSWNGGTAQANADLNTIGASSYTLVVADANGCTTTSGPHIVNNTTAGPTVDVSGMTISNENCGNGDGSIIGITATGVATLSYSWNGGTAQANADLSSQSSGNYTITVTDGNGCSTSSGPHNIGLNAAPVIDVSNMIITDEPCGNGMGSITGITATGNGTLSYTWNGGTAQANADITGQNAGVFNLVVSDGTCSTTSGPHAIGTVAAPVVDVSGINITDATCGNATGSITGVTATGVAALSYSWNGGPAQTNADLNTQLAGAFTLVVTDGNGCTTTSGPHNINNTGGPLIDTTNMFILPENCGNADGAISGVTASGGTGTLSYSWNGGTTQTNADISGQTTGVYNLTVTDAASCATTIGPIYIGLTVGPTIDTANIIVTNEECNNAGNGSITGIIANGNGVLTYDWNSVISTNTDLINASAGAYTLTVTDGNGCTSSIGPINLNMNPFPTIDVSGINISDENCGSGDGSITGIISSGGIGTHTYQWNGSTSAIDLSTASAGSYILTVTDAANCVVASGPHTINGLPGVTATVTGDTVVCMGQTANLTAAGGTIFNWSSGGSNAAESLTPTSTSNYSVIISDGTCSDTVNVTVTVNANPEVSVDTDLSICEGQTATINAASSLPVTWSTLETSNSISVSPAVTTSYFAAVTNSCGTDGDTVVVTVNSNPVIDAGPDESILAGNTVTLNPIGGVSYVWSPQTNLSCTNCASPGASPLTTTTYIVTGTDANGCVSSDTIIVEVDESSVLYIPTAFSPNGDGQNDVLFVRAGAVESFEFSIYDRWGERVFSTTDLSLGWDGSFRGKPLNSAVFVYAISGKYYNGESFEQKGNITLLK